MKYLRLYLLGLLALGVLAVWATGSSSASDWNGVKLAGGPAATAQLALADPLDGGCKVGSLRSDRVAAGSLFEFATGTAYVYARAELADPSNFVPSGVVDQGFELLPAVFDITGSSLADVDIFWAALLLNTVPLSSVEQQMLLDFVEAGRALVVIADVGPNFSTGPNSVAAPFGVRWDDTSFIDAEPTITDASHPIIAGPFGTVASIANASEGSIEDLGAHALEIASNLNGSSIAHVPPAALGPGSGPVVFFSDVNEFTSNDAAGGPGFDRGNNRVLFKNLFAFLSGVCAEPLPTPLPTPVLLVIDEDSIDNGTPPNFFSNGDVNDDIAAVGQRNQLRFFTANVGGTITLHTGQVGDEGWFALKTIPASWAPAGPTDDGLRNYLLAGPGLGSPNAEGNPESLLDKVPDVTPLRATGLKLLQGQGVCAVVYDGDVSINISYDSLSGGLLDGSLMGANLGTVAFKVISVTQSTGFSSASLPEVEIRILDADQICPGPHELFIDAPEPMSSSEPFDVVP